ncbi:hypothetical protein RO3G_03804 [Rhizopus delemar RA 99-880]|uniref:Uncharacterized protein n=1 Tax=Rhizopus delemar (strain RA 99-880 / ATCC MYA-4621 / FGSC 9543 / NRRL 43880) TaxID=246409 RepID=I1BSB9_RHIO9|nr:hypothetical protein RO3G_03804 [Rhizopus delemar RA 99-880]|eukprot:EIE79099.1 hypothetical protein RO3G_03804 [Rhizopus delemar RA 99-880]
MVGDNDEFSSEMFVSIFIKLCKNTAKTQSRCIGHKDKILVEVRSC